MKIKRFYYMTIIELILLLLVACNIMPYKYNMRSYSNQGNVTKKYQISKLNYIQQEDVFAKVKENIENNHIDKAYQLLYRLYRMQEKTGQFSCRLLYELGIVSILSIPPRYRMMDKCFSKVQTLSCYDLSHNYYLKALIYIWKKEKQERILYEESKNKLKLLNEKIEKQNQQIQQLQQQISDLEFKLKKINQIHQEIEKNRSLPINIIPQNQKK